MEGSHSVSSGLAHQDDSWTCQRCGWVYPNAHPSAKHRRNHKKQCGKIKGFELRSELHKAGSSDEASSGDDSHAQKGAAAPAVEHPNALESGDLLVTEVNVPDKIKSHTPILQGISSSLNVKPEVTDHESTRDIINISTLKTDSPASEPEPNIVPLDKESKNSEEGKVMHATLVDIVKEPAHILAGLHIDESKDFAKKDIKCEDPPTINKALRSVEEHSTPHAPQVDEVEAVVRDLPRLDSDWANKADNKGAKSEGFTPKHTESIASLEEPSKTLQDESKVTRTPCLDKVEIAAHKSQGLDSDHAKAKESLLTSKEQGLNRHGSSQGEESWMCRHCGWVYPNPHPSAKHRKKHKKQCGKIKGFELHTAEPHNGGSSDEVSSEEEVHVKKEHVPHQALQPLQALEQANETVATESLPPIIDHPATSVEKGIITESVSNSLQPKDLSAQVDAPDGELRDATSVKDISTPDVVPTLVPELPQNMPSSEQQNLPAGDNMKDSAVFDQVMKVSRVSDEPGTPSTKESPKHFSMKEETLPNEAIVQKIRESFEAQSNEVPSLLNSVDRLASEDRGDSGKDTHVQHGATTKLSEEPAGSSVECTPNVASTPLVSDLKSSDASPYAHFEDKGPSILNVDEPSAVVISATMDPRSVGLSNEALDASKGQGLNHSVILKEERDVSEKPGLSGLDIASNLDALDDTMVNDPLKKKMGDTLTGGSDGQLEPESILSDLSSGTWPADEVPVENKPVTENLLSLMDSSTANVTGLANDAKEEERLVNGQTSANLIQLVPKNELLAQVVEEGNDDAVSSIVDKRDETPSVKNMERLLDNQTATVGVGEVDVPKEVTVPAVITEEAISIQKSHDGFASKNVLSGSEDSGQGRTGGDTESTNTTSFIAKDTGVFDIAKEREVGAISGGISSKKDGEQYKTEASGAPEAMAKPEAKESEAGAISEGISLAKDRELDKTEASGALEAMAKPEAKESEAGGVSGSISSTKDGEQDKTEASGALEAMAKPEAKESEVGGVSGRISSAKDGEQDKTEASGALEAMVKPEAKEATPFEARGLESSDLSYAEAYSFTRSESGVTARSELGASSHKLSDSLEIFEDAQDSLEACSVGGSVEENEGFDESRQASDRLQEGLDEPRQASDRLQEPKHLGVASLDERIPGEIVGLEQKSAASNGSRLGEANVEEKAPTVPGTSYGGRNDMEDLKAPSPEAWQEPGPSNVKSEGKKLSTSEVTEDRKSGESHTALRSLMAKEGPDKADSIGETSTAAADTKSSNRKDGSLASANGTKPKSRSFWRHCICCSPVH